MPLHDAKRVKVIGMTSPERLAIAPDVPTLTEQGTPIVNYGWWGVCAGAGVPKGVIELLNRHVVEAVKASDFRATIEKTGVLATASTVDEFARQIADTAKEAEVMIGELGIEQIE
jgi:tripartite-type tricarboxylate transporter receptor subunit TctC